MNMRGGALVKQFVSFLSGQLLTAAGVLPEMRDVEGSMKSGKPTVRPPSVPN
jgi:hypothetical protein